MNNVIFLKIPTECPYCKGPLKIITSVFGVENLYCNNPNCEGKLINRLDHFCGKKGLDIKGLSKATLEKLITWGWVECIENLFQLEKYEKEWIEKPGFGKTSVNKILDTINKAKECETTKFICALGIPLIGKVASEALVKTFGTYNNFRTAIENKDDKLYQIAGIGEVMIDTLLNYDYTEADSIFKNFITEKIPASASSINTNELEGKVFCITGKLNHYKNRNELKSVIESKGGKVTDSVTSKTTYLINNDTTSTSAKNVTAKKLNVPIIPEEEFITLITPPNPSIEPKYVT